MSSGPLRAGLAVALLGGAWGAARAETPAKDGPLGRVVAVILGSQACGIQPTQAQEKAVSDAGAVLVRRLHVTPAEQRGLVSQFGDGTPDVGCDAFRAYFNGLVDQAVAGAKQ